jgi:hypothetical protein
MLNAALLAVAAMLISGCITYRAALKSLELEVGGEGRLGLIRGGSTVSRIWPLVWATIGERMVASGALAARELEDFIALHHDPNFTWLGPTLVAVWGRRPA